MNELLNQMECLVPYRLLMKISNGIYSSKQATDEISSGMSSSIQATDEDIKCPIRNFRKYFSSVTLVLISSNVGSWEVTHQPLEGAQVIFQVSLFVTRIHYFLQIYSRM